MATDNFSLALVIFVVYISAQVSSRQPYILINGAKLPNNSFVDMRQVANTVPIECRIEGANRRLEADKEKNDTEDQSISAYWYNPAK